MFAAVDHVCLSFVRSEFAEQHLGRRNGSLRSSFGENGFFCPLKNGGADISGVEDRA